MAGYGRLLREARQRRGLSLEEVEATTRIRLRYLAALEAEDTTGLPDAVYARGFLRIYARFLELDPNRILSLYPQESRLDFPPPSRPTPLEIPSSALFAVVLALLLVISLVIYVSPRGEGSSAEGVGVTVQIPLATSTPAPTGIPGVAATASPSRPSPTATPPRVTPTATAAATATSTLMPRVNLPDLTGTTYSQAASRLENLGLRVAKVEEWNDQVAKDLVYRQDPPPGQALSPGSVVRLWVSRGPELVTVPNVVGTPEAEARQILIAAGLEPAPWANRQRWEDLPESERQRHRDTCVGCVLSTTPSPGAEVPPGTVIYLAVRA